MRLQSTGLRTLMVGDTLRTDSHWLVWVRVNKESDANDVINAAIINGTINTYIQLSSQINRNLINGS
jgi:hypothetical protein